MTRVIALTTVVIAGALGAVAIYTWGWRDPSGDQQKKLAASDLEAVYYARGSCCETTALERVGDHAWRATLRNSKGHRVCVLVDLWRFKAEGDREFSGISQTSCS